MAEETVKILFIDTGASPLYTEKVNVPLSEKTKVKEIILQGINRLGVRAYALVKYNNALFTCSHTTHRGNSTQYHREIIPYHPMAGELV